MDLERDIADFLGAEFSILLSQGLSTIPCVIPARARDPRGARPRRGNYGPLGCCFAHHPYPPAVSDAVVVCDREGAESRDTCAARGTVVRHRRLLQDIVDEALA